MARVVVCTIEMRLIEGEHFNPKFKPMTDEKARDVATLEFLDMLNTLDNDGDLFPYVETHVEEVSDG